MLPTSMVSWLSRWWRGLLQVCFLLLCLRFQVAAFREVYPYYWPTLILVVGSMVLGAWKPVAALFAFTLAVPLLDGLAQTAMLTCAFPPALVFSALWIGVTARSWRGSSETDAGIHKIASYPTPSHSHTPSHLFFVTLITDILITAMLLSLAYQIWHHRDLPGLWSAFSNRSVFGYGEQFYFITSAYLWLQGFFFFRYLGPHIQETAISTWIKPMFIIYGVTMVVFVLIQYFCNIPEGWQKAGFQSPYEDISSFGSLSVAVFIFALTIQRRVSWPRLIGQALCLSVLLALVIASWSRATWLAGIIFSLVIACLRLPRWCSLLIILLVVATIVVINGSANSDTFRSHLYLTRLVALVRLENVASKSPERMELYHRAYRMLQKHPLTGHGIGSFYLTSKDYATHGDYRENEPDFAHNIFLQIATEQGVPIAALLAGLCSWTLYQGFSAWIKRRNASKDGSDHALACLGVLLALSAYLETGMTGNSLNVYVSNQFFFWFLVAALIMTSEGINGCACQEDFRW